MSSVINWGVYALAQDPELQSQLWKDARTIRMRMFTPGSLSDRVAMKDDIIPLSKPIRAADGSSLDSISVQKGQV